MTNSHAAFGMFMIDRRLLSQGHLGEDGTIRAIPHTKGGVVPDS